METEIIVKHKITTTMRVPVTFDGKEWDASDQAFGMPLEPTDYLLECGDVHPPEEEGPLGPWACVKAMNAADREPLDSWELTQLLAKAHGAVLIGARELELLRRTIADVPQLDADWARVTDGDADSNDAIEDKGAELYDWMSRMYHELRQLPGFSAAAGPSAQTAYEKQGGK